MKSMKRVSAWTLATVLLMGAVSQAASPLDDKVPSETIAYFGWAGSTALEPQYAGSNLKGVVDASAARQFISQQLPKLIDVATHHDLLSKMQPPPMMCIPCNKPMSFIDPAELYFSFLSGTSPLR